MLDWQVIFFDNVPTWQWGSSVTLMDSPFGQVRVMNCTTVVPVQNGFLEVKVATGKNPEMTFLIRADHVLAARSAKETSSLGFGSSAMATTAPTTPLGPQNTSSSPNAKPPFPPAARDMPGMG